MRMPSQASPAGTASVSGAPMSGRSVFPAPFSRPLCRREKTTVVIQVRCSFLAAVADAGHCGVGLPSDQGLQQFTAGIDAG